MFFKSLKMKRKMLINLINLKDEWYMFPNFQNKTSNDYNKCLFHRFNKSFPHLQ